MNLTHRCKNLSFLTLVTAGVFLALAFLFWSVALAAEEAQIEAAIKDLSSAVGQNITSEEQAKTFCNQEQYFDVCADIGKKHGLYEAEELKHVNEFLAEVKGKILTDIKNCSNEECLIRVAGELAKQIQIKNPTLATDFKLTTTVVSEKQAVVQAAKEIGVSLKDCEAMDPDNAPLDLLRKCARLAKDTRVQQYIPEERRVLAGQFGDTTIKLREALTAGRYQCGDGTLEGCGNFCLKPTAGTQATGIPEVCKQIATEVFGPDGVKELEAAHQQVGKIQDFYSKKFILTLPNGKELVGEGQIRNACDQAFSGRNLEIAKACGSFAVQNGFVTQAEVEKGLKLLESFNQRGQNTSFDQCVSNPTACREFIPEDERGRFDAGNQIFEIMRTEIGFDPSQCERGAEDQAIGLKCFEGSKRALAKIEGLGLAKQSREAGFIIEEIRSHVSEGENMTQKREQFQQVFNQRGGPGGCKSQTECFTYCSNPTNGPECIAFGAQQGVSGFRGREAVEKYQEYNQNLQRPGLTSNEYKEREFNQYSGQGPYPGFQPPGQGGFPPGQIPGFNQSRPGFGGQAGPSPECFAAIQSGDFVKAKTVCASSVPSVQTHEFPICPASPYVECPAGQYRESSRNSDGCWIDGPCRPASSYSPGPYPTYTYYPTPPVGTFCGGAAGVQCPAGYYCQMDGAYPDAGGKCVSSSFPEKSAPSCPSGQWWDYTYNTCTSSQACGQGLYWDTVSQSCKPSTASSCSSSLIKLLGDGCHQMYTDTSGKLVYCDGPMSKSAKEGDTATTAGCSSPSVSSTPPPSCPAGQWWDYAANKCSTGSCSTGYYWDSATSTCKTSTTTYTPYPTTSPTSGGCPTDSHTMGSYCMSNNDGSKCGPLNSTSVSSFGSCSSYNTYSPSPPNSSCSASLIQLLGTGCHQMYTDSSSRLVYCDGPMSKSAKEGDTATTAGCSGGGPTYSYPPPPYPSSSPTSGGSCPSGAHTMYVNNAGGYCMSDSDGAKCGPLNSTSVSSFGSCSSYTTTYTYTPSPSSSSCPSGQWWDTATSKCTSTATSCGTGYYWDSASNVCKSTCPSTQYWNGSACVDNAVTVTYTPPPPSTPSCPSGQWWSYTANSCQGGSTETYTPPPYTPPPSCPAGEYWSGSACVANPTPYPITPYPTPVSMLDTHQMAMANMIMACSNSGGQWDVSYSTCAVKNNGLFANILKVFSKFLTGR